MQLIRTGKDEFVCTAAAFAMALEIPLDVVFGEVGHTGMEVEWPDLPIPHCYRGIHPQALFDVSRRHGYAVTQIERNPLSQNQRGDIHKIRFLETNDRRFNSYLMGNMGVLVGHCVERNSVHFMAWDSEFVYDSRGLIYPISPGLKAMEYNLEIFYILDKIPLDR